MDTCTDVNLIRNYSGFLIHLIHQSNSALTDAVRPVNQLAVGIPGALETACSGDRDVANASSVELSSELQSSRFSKIPKVSMNRSSFHPICDFSFDGHLD